MTKINHRGRINSGEVVLLYDGICVFCESYMLFLMKRERKGRVRFAALQSDFGQDVSKQLEKSFKKSGIKIMTNSSVENVDTKGKGCVVSVKTAKGEEKIECDVVLSAVGIQANIENIGLEDLGIITDHGKILVNDFLLFSLTYNFQLKIYCLKCSHNYYL